MKKVVGYIIDTFIIILFIISTIFFIGTLKGKTNYFGYKLVEVKTGSMEASGINIRDVRLIKSVDRYEVGDIIAFHKDGSIYFHLAIEEVKSGFITQGTSNLAPDSGIARHEDIIDKQISNRNFNWFVSVQFRITLILLVYLIIMFFLGTTLYDILFENNIYYGGSKGLVLIFLFLLLPALQVYALDTNNSTVNHYTEYEVFIDTGYFTIVNDEVVGYDNSSGETVVTFPAYNSNGEPITVVTDKVIRFNNNVEVVIVPPSITSLGKLNFQHCPNLKELIVLAENPICSFSNQGNPLVGIDIYVPDSVVHIYKTTHPWSIYASRIFPLSSRTN